MVDTDPTDPCATSLQSSGAIDFGDPTAAWMVIAGHVDVFAIEPEPGGAPGRRRALFTLPASEVLVGIDLADSPLRLEAYPSQDAQLMPLGRPLDPVWRDHWAARIARLIVAGGGGRVRLLAAGGEVLAAGERIGATATPGWLIVHDGALSVGDAVRLEPGVPLWWAEPLWATALDPVAVTVYAEPPDSDTADGDGLAGLHRLALAAIAVRLEAAAVDAAGAWRMSRERDEAAFRNSMVQLAEVVARPPDATAADRGDEPPLADALQAVMSAFVGGTLRRVAPGEPVPEALERQQLRGRHVLLRPGWQKETAEPLLAALGADRLPVALLPGRRGWRVVGRGIDASLDDALVDRLAPEAWQVYRGLPDRALKTKDLLLMGFGRSRGDVARLVALAVGGAWLASAIPLASREVFDNVVPTADFGLLVGVVAMLLTIAVTQAGFQIANAIAMLRVEARFEAGAMPALMDRLLRQSAGFFRGMAAGDLTNRLLGVQSARQLISSSLTIGLFACSMLLSSLGVLFRLNVFMAVCALGTALAIALVNAAIQRLQFRAAKVGGQSRGMLDAFVLQLIAGMAKLRVAAAERRAMVQWAEKFSRMAHKSAEGRRYTAAQQMFDGLLPVVATAILFWVIAGGTQPMLSSGEIVAFAIAFGQLIAALLQLAAASSQAVLVAPMIGRIKPLLDSVPERRPDVAPLAPLDGEITLHNLSFRYAGTGPLVLDDLSADIPAGSFVAFVGASGSGKSTLFRCFLGFETPDAGEILFDRRPMEEIDPAALRRQIGVVLQNGKISSGTLLDNIAGPAAVSVAAAWEAARAVGLDRDIEAMPMGMHTVLLDGGGTLSGGQRQRLLIARALMHRPRILLFDEATSALDNRTQAIVTQTLRQLAITRIVIAHRLSTITDVDRVFVMDRGRIVQSGGYAELLEAPGPFADLARRQLAQ